MVEATLAYARGVGQGEALQRVDVAAYLSDLHTNTEGDLKLRPGPGAQVQIRPLALRRALRNLIERSIAQGRVCEEERRKRKEWARCLDAEHGAAYVMELTRDSAASPPWIKASLEAVA